jgi:predicted dehydrogenase
MKLNVAVIGAGYWGPNLIRNFNKSNNFNLLWICDKNQKVLEKYKNSYNTSDMLDDVLNDDQIHVVAIATPILTHYNIAKQCLLKGKHVFVEKPLTNNYHQACELVKIAKDNNLILMCDHTYLYNPAVHKIKEIIETGDVGNFLYMDSIRTNLGSFQNDINVIWDLAPHDISIFKYLFPTMNINKTEIRAFDPTHTGSECNGYITLFLDNGKSVNIHVNWLSPVKMRRMVLCFTKKMIVWNDVDVDEKIKVYDKGINIDYTNKHKILITYRMGDIIVPKVDNYESLSYAINDLHNSITTKKQPISNADLSLDIVKILDGKSKE